MFGAGWTEMLIIGIVALVVIGPKDLPVVMRKIGRVVATVRRMGGEFQREINKTTGLDQITDLRRSITEPLRQTSEQIANEFNRQTATGVEPTGIVKPADPKTESVYETIAATSGVPVTVPAPPPVMKPLASVAEPLPAPAEAAVLPPAAVPPVAKKPAKPRATPAKLPVAAKAAEAPTATRAAPRKPAAKAPPAEKPAAAVSPSPEATPSETSMRRRNAAPKPVAATAPASKPAAPRARAKKA